MDSELIEKNQVVRKKNRYKLLIFSLGTNIIFVLAVLILLLAEFETKQGINFKVHAYKIPLYIKVFGLFARDYEYRRIANMIVGTEKDEQKIVENILEWTDKFIAEDFPKSFPIYDDHILNIIHRGYGTGDQRIDVATTLSTYAGARAFWGYIISNDKRTMISYFKINGLWYVFEPHEWSFFYKSSGELATIEYLQNNPEYIKIDNKIPIYKDVPLTEYYKNLKIIEDPQIIRPEYQMPYKRLKYKIFKMIN